MLQGNFAALRNGHCLERSRALRAPRRRFAARFTPWSLLLRSTSAGPWDPAQPEPIIVVAPETRARPYRCQPGKPDQGCGIWPVLRQHTKLQVSPETACI